MAWTATFRFPSGTLANGLEVLVLPRRHAPIVVCDLYYPVGSFDEPPGLTGLAHFVEHMLFKGTERFPKGQIDRLVLVAAGQSNAETFEDGTHYWFTFPSDRWELALAIEADRMHGARFDPREVEVERQVIGEERARELNSPQGRLEQTHLAVTYLRHPYRNPILGWPDDIARINVDDLKTFYRAHYRPEGAILVVGRRCRARGGTRPNRQPLRRRAGGRAAAAEAGDRRAAPDRSTRFHALRAGVGRAGPARLAHGAAGSSRRSRPGRARRSALLRPARAALAIPGRDRPDSHVDRSSAHRGAPCRAVLHPA